MVEDFSLPIASTQKRVGAFVIDDLIVSFFILIIFYDQLIAITSNLSGSMSSEEGMILMKAQLEQFSKDNFLTIILIRVAYHAVLVWQNGMTLGKYIMKIKVIDFETGYNPSLTKAFLRGLLRIGSEIVFYLGFIMAFKMPFKQTFHDKFSNCVVVDA